MHQRMSHAMNYNVSMFVNLFFITYPTSLERTRTVTAISQYFFMQTVFKFCVYVFLKLFNLSIRLVLSFKNTMENVMTDVDE